MSTRRSFNPADVFIIDTATIPNPNWLRPGVPSSGQKAFGDALLATRKFIFDPGRATGAYALHTQEPFALDTH